MTHFSVHSNPFHLLINKKKGLHLSIDQEMNLFKAAAILVNFCTSLGFRGDCKLLIAFYLIRVDFNPSVSYHIA